MGIEIVIPATAADTKSIAEVQIGDEYLFKRLFLRGIDCINHNEFPPGSAERKQFVISVFGNKNLVSNVGAGNRTAFHYAVIHKSSEVVQVLIDEAKRLPSPSSANANPLESLLRQADALCNTALHKAVENGGLEIAKLLVDADPDYTHIQNLEGETPVCIAARLGYNHIVKMMCTTCTAPAFDGPDGTTALHAAITNLPEAYSEGSDVVEVILEAAGRKHFATNSPNHTFEDFIRQADDDTKNTALHLAVLGKHLGVVKQILIADRSYKNTDNNSDLKTPLYIAAEQGYKDIVRELCEHSASLDDALGPRKQTALHAAIIGGDKDCVKMVLESCRHLVFSQDEVDWTPLHYAAYYKFDSVIDMIIRFSNSFALNLGRRFGYYQDGVNTPLWLATKEGHSSTVIILMKLLPNLCDKFNSKDGRNILHLAAFQSDKQMIQTILKFCPAEYIHKLLNGKDDDGNTPLHLLINKGCFVKELIEHEGIDQTTRNNDNLAPLDMLHIENNITADQLQIKKTLDGLRANQHSKIFGRRGSKLESQESVEVQSRQYAALRNAAREWKKTELQRTSNQIVVTALITTVSFTVGFTMPGGYYQNGPDQGMVFLSKKQAFSAFMLSDALALALSTTTLFLYFFASIYEDPYQVSKLNLASSLLNSCSIIAMMLAFITGTYVVLSHSPALAISVCFICSTFFLSVIVLIIKTIYDRSSHRLEV